jgi:asparagine synthase (glutamine-hydrolysing)
MCGFAGFVDLDRPLAEQRALARRALRGIAHRGVDEMGTYSDGRLGLASVRTAIIDRPRGQQPMTTHDRRHWLGYNGELFNYLELRAELEARGVRFVTDSDTEVLLYALAHWGEDAIPRLNGQFAFVFYDRLTGEILFARDRFGERPLFYGWHGGAFTFASEIKGLFALPFVPRRLSVRGLRQAAMFWAPVAGTTCFDGVAELPPGHQAVYRDGALAVRRYFELPFAARKPPRDLDAAKAELRAALDESVRLRLRGDFEVAAFVSGGIDSTVVAHLANARLDHRLRTFGLAFEDPRIDESEAQLRVARWLDSDHSIFTVTAADVRELFPSVALQTEMPLFRTAPVASRLLAQHVQGAGIRIVLGGEGGDEVLAGYDICKEAAFVAGAAGPDVGERARWLAGAFDDLLTTAPLDVDGLVGFYEALARRPPASMALGPHLRRFRAEAFADALVDPGRREDDELELLEAIRRYDPAFDERPPVERAQVVDMVTLLSGYGLACQGDRMGAWAALEARFPFLDPNVAEVCLRLPDAATLRGGRSEKWILREAFAGEIPASIRRRPKRAMRAPGAETLLRDERDDWVADLVSDATLRGSDVVDPARARALVEAAHRHADGRVPYPLSHAYVQLLSTLLLERHYVREHVVPDVDVERTLVRQFDEPDVRERGAIAASEAGAV